MEPIHSAVLPNVHTGHTKFPMGPRQPKLREIDLLNQERRETTHPSESLLPSKHPTHTRPLRDTSESKPPPQGQTPDLGRLSDQQPFHVLLAEDDETVRLLTGRYLELHGIKVTAGSNGLEAYQRFLSTPEHFDVLLTDLQMPELSGQQLAHLVRQQRPELPILFVSGFSAEPIQLEDYLSGPTTFLPKPYALAHLLNALRNLVHLSAQATPHANA
ncbi:MAG: response regulator [Myxococcales bacterium]|nr:response regulator [Myxococcales bacterium]MCB9644024.1 response regulator [Myxococcales bacterium]